MFSVIFEVHPKDDKRDSYTGWGNSGPYWRSGDLARIAQNSLLPAMRARVPGLCD
jgi:hypothetical protein